MRVGVLLVLLGLSPTTGCTYFVATSGKQLGTLETHEEVLKEFGPPVATGQEDGKYFEEFRTRRKISDWTEMNGYAMGYGMTLGLIELYALPRQLFITSKRSVIGQELRFVYDQTGEVVLVRLDGEVLPGHPNQQSPRASPTKSD